MKHRLYLANKQQPTCGLLLGWQDVVAIDSKSLINSGRRATFINSVYNNFKFSFLTRSVAGLDVFQISAQQQAVDVGCYY